MSTNRTNVPSKIQEHKLGDTVIVSYNGEHHVAIVTGSKRDGELDLHILKTSTPLEDVKRVRPGDGATVGFWTRDEHPGFRYNADGTAESTTKIFQGETAVTDTAPGAQRNAPISTDGKADEEAKKRAAATQAGSASGGSAATGTTGVDQLPPPSSSGNTPQK